MWEILCGRSGNLSRTSKHILVFVFDPLSLNSFSLTSCIASYCSYSYMLSIGCVSILVLNKRASYSISTLNLKESRGDSSEPFMGNSVTFFGYT